MRSPRLRHHLADNRRRLRQHTIQRPNIAPTGLRQIRPPTALAANLRRQRAHNLPRLHTARQILRHAHNQRNFSISSPHPAPPRQSPASHASHPPGRASGSHSSPSTRCTSTFTPFTSTALAAASAVAAQADFIRIRIQFSPQLLHLLFLLPPAAPAAQSAVGSPAPITCPATFATSHPCETTQ